MAKYPLASPLSLELVTKLKRTLHRQMPSVRSSHLREAIARGLEFHTAAALQTALKAPIAPPATLDADAMTKRLAELGYEEMSLGHTIVIHLVALMNGLHDGKRADASDSAMVQPPLQPRPPAREPVRRLTYEDEPIEYTFDVAAKLYSQEFVPRSPLPEVDLQDVLRHQNPLYVVLPRLTAADEFGADMREKVIDLVETARATGFVFKPSAIGSGRLRMIEGDVIYMDSKGDSVVAAGGKPWQGLGSKRSRDAIVDTLVERGHLARKPSGALTAAPSAAAKPAVTLYEGIIDEVAALAPLKLSRESQMNFADALLNPPAPNEALLKAAEAHDRLIDTSDDDTNVLPQDHSPRQR